MWRPPPLARLGLRRLGWAAGLVAVISVLIFAATEVLPGDAASRLLGQNYTPERYLVVRRELNLDVPAPLRYLRWLWAFRRYWTAHAISTAGSTVSLVVLPLLLFQRTGSALLTALLGTVYIAPYVLLGLFAGALADRLDRRRLMVGCEFGSAVALGSIPVASSLGVLTTAQLFIATAIAGSIFVVFDSARFGALPALFGRERLIMAMTALGTIDNTFYIVGTAVGGLLATTIGAAPAIGLDAASFVASGVLLTTVRGSFGDQRGSQTTAGRWRWRSDIAEAARFLWHHRLIRALTLAGSAAALTGGAVTGLLVVFAVRQLGLSDHDARIGLLFSAGSVGALTATMLVPRLTRSYDVPRLNLVARTASLLLVVGLAVLRNFALALAVYLAFNVADMLAIRSAIAFRQLNTPDHLKGRVNVVGRMTALAGQPIGAALGGAIAQVTDLRTALLIMSLGLTAGTIGGWLSPLRTATTVSARSSGFGNESSHEETEAPTSPTAGTPTVASKRRDGRSQPPA
ncbi:MAG: MFS transporter [Pseudonocardiales bacterium]|nr:MFS transporter [Pseudonocardiales bacterium]MBV9028858.1 MFS transporter [Pseudonocardiales bacterium]MBW0010822.1 MFS transporter [Pseudonocardiales bacterium]